MESKSSKWIKCAILVIDMCDFSKIMEEVGVEQTIRILEAMQNVAIEKTITNNGEFLKAWADNVISLFPTVEEALEAATDIMSVYPVSIGIGYGDMYYYNDDVYGNEVNKVCKLGEDIAECGEILLTDEAKKNLND